MIPFSDPIWGRLYGPHGVQDVPKLLFRLAETWDEQIANDLFWDKLFHQDTLYPVTYAAMPWLLTILERAPTATLGCLHFAGQVYQNAQTDPAAFLRGVAPQGLAQQAQAHHHNFLSSDTWLMREDEPAIQDLAETFLNDASRWAVLAKKWLTNSPAGREQEDIYNRSVVAGTWAATRFDRDVAHFLLNAWDGYRMCIECNITTDYSYEPDGIKFAHARGLRSAPQLLSVPKANTATTATLRQIDPSLSVRLDDYLSWPSCPACGDVIESPIREYWRDPSRR